MDPTEFLKSLGMDKNERQKGAEIGWPDIVRPETVSLILGRKGKGKSGLAYWLCESTSARTNLLPVVINLPTERRTLIPESWVIRGMEDIHRLSDCFIIIDEGTTELPAGSKLEEFIKACQALSRQRNQIIVFIFHASSDVGSRILRGMDGLLIKEPSQRQIEHGAKTSWWKELLMEAKGKFEALEEIGANPKEYTFVDSEDPEFRGMLVNPLASFWSEELSKAWAGVDTLNHSRQVDLFTPERVQYGKRIGWHIDDPKAETKHIVTPQMEREAVELERHSFNESTAVIYEHRATGIRWVEFRR